jgi:hypothetical protein
MTRRHYGIRVPKPCSKMGRARSDASIGGRFIAAAVVMLIALGILLFGVAETIIHSQNTASAPHATGYGTAR